ncbi:MAG TPA: hypothetical protein DCL76_02970 [Chloroflexi bacterium]|nr:hypothetical protein [Chloroflexota bacterium]
MTLNEYVGNCHNHTPYSDGTLYHADIAHEASRAGLDFVIVTDHNVWVHGREGYYDYEDSKTILILTGEEIHHLDEHPKGNHLLVYDTNTELSQFSSNPQLLIDKISALDGLSFLAHPFERAAPIVEDAVYSWRNWNISGYTGIEVWNYMSEFKSLIKSKAAAIFYAFYPDLGIRGPFQETLHKWDELLASGKNVVIIGNSDSHGQTYSMGPVSRCIFPYKFLFQSVNTHIISRKPLTGNITTDKQIVYSALRTGNCFVGYDLPHPTRDFRFHAYNEKTRCIMGEEISLKNGPVTLEATTPTICNLKIISNGKIITQKKNTSKIKYTVNRPNNFRIEATITHKLQERHWIISNPIYVK